MEMYEPSNIQQNLIYSPSITSARRYLDEILRRDAEYVCWIKRGEDYCELGDSEIFYCKSSPDSCRGAKVDRIYVDKRTTLDVLFTYLLPLLIDAKPNYKWGTELEFF